ncbi:uncharacterized protein LOC107802577 isoform X4 [Nicotiana tabacum]|uniref:Uncharacterized protein LOC107802577 isoform X4 n=1 Tax=Nicotiana tabacum TaxID=4097 RepID=A0A1S4AY36_TOBAC|nr:PREDICTED: uncharacterized protein LOC107802577 isoform X4 [Nicotiana tabacum]
MRHPTDSIAWKTFDELHQSFASEPRNVRLGLASDGFQSFGNSKTPYSIWPVVLIPYNLPPWLCMKKENFILSMIIPGPESPGDAIDVYLQPLIEELKELWESGVKTFDASTKQNFVLHASLLWTINDFPAYANLSGWSTKGKLACPCCNKETHSIRLQNCKKQCYMGHRRFLPLNHKWRNDKASFNGTKEKRLPPKQLSGDDILDQVADLYGLQLTKDPKKKIKISHESRGDNWNKKSIFFDLPYWKALLLRHNLDVMHIEKNICDNILGTILNIKGKTKDTINTRLDLQAMNIRKELHPIKIGDKYDLPTACYTLSPEEKDRFFSFLKNLKVPDGFSSNIFQCVNLKDRKISGLKSHDCHVLLQHLLPLALRGMLCKSVCELLIELSLFFNVLGSKCLSVDELEQIDAQIPITECKLEKVFPPTFFDVMEHLPIHLANEAKIAGPSQYRWMYPMERYIYFIKPFIRNRACAEGSIAEGYLATECMTLCSRYIHTMETKFNRLERNYDGGIIESDGGLTIFCHPGRALRDGKPHKPDSNELEQAHIYILKNCDEIQPFLEKFSLTPIDTSQENSDMQFIGWLKEKVDMNPSKYQKSKMESSSKTVKHVYVPPGTLARGRRQSFRALGSIRVNAEQRGDTLFPHEEEEMQGTRRSEIRLCESEKVKKLRGTNWCKNVAGLKVGENVAPPSFVQTFEGDTLFPHEEEEMQGTQRSEIRLCESEKIKKLKGTNWYKNVAGLRVGENVAPPSFDQTFEGDTDLFPHEEEEMQGTHRSEIRLKVGENVAPPGFDQIFENDTDLFPHEEEETQGTQRSERLCESEKV